MQFTLQTLMLSFVVVAAAVGLCGPWGMLLAAAVLVCAGYIRMAKDRDKAWKIVIIILSSCLIGMLLYAMQSPRINSFRLHCINNQHQITLALHHYASEHGHFPPAYIADADGKPMHSWRVLLLPYLDRKDIYEAYNFKEFWNGPNNSKLISQMPHIFACPSNNKKPDCTNYVAVVGPKTAWPGEKTCSTDEITAGDGCSETILLMELPNSDINWMEPRDLAYEELCDKMTPYKRAEIFGAHNGVSVVSFVDGHTVILSEPFLQKNIGALLTKNGGEKIDFNDQTGPSYYRPAEKEPDVQWIISTFPIIASLIILFGTILLIIYRPLPGRDDRKAAQAAEIHVEDSIEIEVKSVEKGINSGEENSTP
jgi:hypothetical protein